MPSRMPRFHSADRPLTPARRFPTCVPGSSREMHGCRGDPSFPQSPQYTNQGRPGAERVCTSVTSPAHHVPSEPGSPYSKAQRGGLDGSGHSAWPFQGTTDLQMQRLLYREAASGLPGQHFPPQLRMQARNEDKPIPQVRNVLSVLGTLSRPLPSSPEVQPWRACARLPDPFTPSHL